MGLRALKKEQTRQDIADKAFELFAARGFDRVTVAEIAEAAGVSEKTVFNYFPTKEDVFFDEVPEREAALVAAVREREPGESVIATLRRLDTGLADRLANPGFAQWARVIEDSPALRAKELEVMAALKNSLAATIEGELSVDAFLAHVAASQLVAAHWQVFVTARERALAGKHGPAAARRLRADAERAYDLVERGLGDLKDGPRGPSVHATRRREINQSVPPPPQKSAGTV
jgi:AcrR family transcriptional regulator